jgi:oxepin-CoA hydrolase/3-oxo-5,6-dehydrosuberyl-CoA semialdehyde dehydrogenase
MENLMQRLDSYVAGEWVRSNTEGVPFHNAVNGEQIGTISSDGVDFAAMVANGRDVGGPALRELTFHQRAALAK